MAPKSATKVSIKALGKWLSEHNGKATYIPKEIEKLPVKRSLIEKYKADFGGTSNDWVKAQLDTALKNEVDFPKDKAGKVKEPFKERDTSATVTHVGNVMLGGVVEALKLKSLGKEKIKVVRKGKDPKEQDIEKYPKVSVRYAGGMIIIFNPSDKAKVDKLVAPPK